MIIVPRLDNLSETRNATPVKGMVGPEQTMGILACAHRHSRMVMPVYPPLRKVGEDDLVAALAMSSRNLREARFTATSVNAAFVDGRETFSKEGV